MFKANRFIFAASRVCARTSIASPVRSAVAFTPKMTQMRPVQGAASLRITPCRFYSNNRVVDVPAKEVTYKEVKEIVEKPNGDIVIVDVREPAEYEAGHIPNAINIPYKTMPGALGLESAEFESQFGFPKPDKSKTLLFYCRSGVRSTGSEQLANTYGYENRLNYKGSYLDWSENEHGDAANVPNPDEKKAQSEPTPKL